MKENIKNLSAFLLKDTIGYSEIQETIHQIHKNFKLHTPISGAEQDIKLMAAVPTANGMALGLTHAAQCLLDYKRTQKLLKGMVSAIKDIQQKTPNKTVHVFYAGCGPYAPFITLVAPLFSIKEVQFTLLDINQDSITSANTLIDNLGLSAYVKDYYIEDAVTFQIPKPENFHILFSETLDAMLYRESYVPILINMIGQLSDDIIIIPENVYLTANIFDTVSNDTPIVSTEIFNTRKAIAKDHYKDKFPAVGMYLKPEYKEFVIETTVVIYKDHILKSNESCLTIPCKFLLPQPLEIKKSFFTYFLKPQVELKLEYDEVLETAISKSKEETAKKHLSADRVQLPFTFDAVKLAAEFKTFKLKNFEYYKVIPLREPAFKVDKSIPSPAPATDYADGSWTDWLDTEFLKNAPYVNKVINTFKEHTTVNLVRILRLAPNATIQEHTDPTLALEEENSMIRLTIPILNKYEKFYLNGTLLTMKPGECWYLRLSDPHKISNTGNSERVNLTIDMIPNTWIRNIIDKHTS